MGLQLKRWHRLIEIMSAKGEMQSNCLSIMQVCNTERTSKKWRGRLDDSLKQRSFLANFWSRTLFLCKKKGTKDG